MNAAKNLLIWKRVIWTSYFLKKIHKMGWQYYVVVQYITYVKSSKIKLKISNIQSKKTQWRPDVFFNSCLVMNSLICSEYKIVTVIGIFQFCKNDIFGTSLWNGPIKVWERVLICSGNTEPNYQRKPIKINCYCMIYWNSQWTV